MASPSLQLAFESWLRSAADKRVDAASLWEAAPREGSSFAACVRGFGLDALDERILAALFGAYADPTALTPASLARILDRSLGDLEERLQPAAKLRRHALVLVDGALQGRAPLGLGAGLALRLFRDPMGAPPSWLDGVTAIPAPAADAAGAQRFADRFAVGPRLQDPLRHFVGHETRLALVAGASPRDAVALGAAVGRKLNRRVVVVEGWELACRADRRDVLRALRRDAELDGSVLVVAGALEVRDAFAVLREPLAPAPAKPLCVLFCDERDLPYVAMPPGDEYGRLIEVRLGKPDAATLIAANAGAAPSAPGLGDPAPRPDPFAQYRQQAAADAERAMGPSVNEIRSAASSAMRMPTPQKTAMPAPDPSALAVPVATAAPPPSPAPTPTPPPAAPSDPPIAAGPAVAPEGAAAIEAKSEKKAEKGKKAKKGKKGDAPEAAAAPPPPEPQLPPPPPAPYVDVPKGAAPRVLAQIAMTCPNPEQRIELITAIAEFKEPHVVAALRANAKSEHPGVRAAAEVVMARLFGPNWNAQRAIPKPVQPPRSDDDRGPPGA